MAEHCNYLSATVIVDMDQPAPETRAGDKHGVVRFDFGLCGHFEIQSQDPAALRRVGQAFLAVATDLAFKQIEAKKAGLR